MQWLLKNFGKKFTAVLASGVLLVCNNWLHWGVSEEQVKSFLEMLTVYLAGQSAADALTGGVTSSLSVTPVAKAKE